MSVSSFFNFFTSKKYSFSESSDSGVTNYSRFYPEGGVKINFKESRPFKYFLYYYDSSGRKIEFTILQPIISKTGVLGKVKLTKTVDGSPILMQKTDLQEIDTLFSKEFQLLEKQKNVGIIAEKHFKQILENLS